MTEIRIENTLKNFNTFFGGTNANTGYIINDTVSNWFKDNGIKCTYSRRVGGHTVFAFDDSLDAVAFKLRWI